MYNISLKNGKSFTCDANTTIFEAAKAEGIFLEHSCLTARCRSCLVQIEQGSTKDKLDDLVLSPEEKSQKLTLSCNAIPTSDLLLDVEDLGDVTLYEKKIVPAKIQAIHSLTHDVVEVILRLPPTATFAYNSGQYVNLSKGDIKRSYSVASAYKLNESLHFFIKKYKNGQMSQYWFENAKPNDLLRMEGPLGSFFLRETTKKNIVFLATGTGIAPVKAILEQVQAAPENYADKVFWLFFGARNVEDVFWEPTMISLKNLQFIKALSRELNSFDGHKGYVQDAMIQKNINFSDAQVYACGSNDMIQAAKKVSMEHGLPEKEFFSDAFICTN